MDALLSYADVTEHYGITVPSMRNRVLRGDAPTPVLGRGGRVRGWRREEIERYDRVHTMSREQYLYKKRTR
ncbi:hypothetical protein [Bifidobacterium jacchi]|uniref:DNA-binding protein n=1 Tax=Bifidobacterium jacchi TaxID=2490545 RepID=A0A5N5RM68_9BIFI|nr:hypothetical protein [Bifidobacterium jacchi]KAB5608387.1 hypothetical protein EHS19_01830 [Bifidobacterium jacchi]